jgi:hypothetical protein
VVTGYGAPVMLVCLFDVPGAELDAFAARARTAVLLLAQQPGCRAVCAGPAVDEPSTWVLSARFDSVPAYRRSLSPFAVREHVAPLLARCRGGVPTTFELLLDGADGAVVESASLHGTDSGPRPWAADPPGGAR